MLTRDNLHDNQLEGIDLIHQHKRLALWMLPGSGKTVTTLTALDELDLVEDVYPALVLAPLRVARDVWPFENAIWGHLRHLRIEPITGPVEQRHRALKRQADIYTVNYENIPWLVATLGENWPFKTIVADEATRTKSFRLRQGSTRMQVLSKVAWRSDRFIELTGSPSANGIKDLWGQIWFLDRGERLGKSFSAFEARWFRRGYDGYTLEPMAHAQDEVQERLRDICFTIEPPATDDPIINLIWVDLPRKARDAYYDLEKEFFAKIAEHEIEAANAAVKGQKLLQLANGAIYHDEYKNWTETHSAKLEALDSLIEEANGNPILLSYNWVHDKERLLKRYPFARFLKTKQDEDDWNAGKIPLLVTHPGSAGHGLNLQHGGHIIVYFGIDWPLEYHEQILERIGPRRQKQSGYDRPVYIHMILARDTLDEAVLERLQSKRSIQEILLEAMKSRRADAPRKKLSLKYADEGVPYRDQPKDHGLLGM